MIGKRSRAFKICFNKKHNLQHMRFRFVKIVSSLRHAIRNL